jgi:riboflavin kinase/FMN adenylyltransferase
MGYPTANVECPAFTAIPADGVYAGHLVTRDPRGGASRDRFPAAISVGSNPTFQGSRRTVEAYVLDYDGDLYGEHVGVEFVQRLRAMAAFPDVEALLAAMAKDVTDTRSILGM